MGIDTKHRWYTDKNGDVYDRSSYCLEPTATVEGVTKEFKTSGAIGCMNFDGYTPIADPDTLKVVESMERAIRAERKRTKKAHDLAERAMSRYDQLADKYEELASKHAQLLQKVSSDRASTDAGFGLIGCE